MKTRRPCSRSSFGWLLLAMILAPSAWAASLHQAAFDGNSQSYRFGYNSIVNLPAWALCI